ncbi:MAG: ribonuclease HII [Pseudomonadota bacterium]
MAKKSKTFEPFPWEDLSPQPVIGVDEVGRGCLAGPVYAAAVVVSPGFDTTELTDSKKLSEKKREELAEKIHSGCDVALGFATVQEIDEINILWASLLAMKRAVDRLKLEKAHVLVDGNKKIPKISLPQTTLVKGDLRAAPVAAASIVAKVYRDNLMKELGEKFPGYGLEDHKGYATPIHKEAIASLGPQKFHRSSFAGVREHL